MARSFWSLLFSMFLFFFALSLPAQWTPSRNFTVRDGLSQSQVTDILQDSAGYIWIATQGGVSRFNGRRFEVFTTLSGLPDDVVMALAADDEGSVWVGTDAGYVACWDRMKWVIFTPPQESGSDSINGLCAVRDGAVLLGYDSGLFQLGYRGTTLLRPGRIRELCTDQKGGAWILSDELMHFHDGTIETVILPSSLSAASIRALQGVPDGLWVAWSNGDVAFFKNNQIVETLHTGLEFISAIEPSGHGGYWVGTTLGLYHVTPDSPPEAIRLVPGESQPWISDLFVDHEGSLWVGTWGGGLFQYSSPSLFIFNRATGLPASTIWSVIESPEGTIWMGTDESGALEWTSRGWGRSIDRRSGLPSNTVSSLGYDTDGNLWIGTDRGISRWKQDQPVSTWREKDGLPNDFIYCLTPDPEQGMWAGTDNGLIHFSGDTWNLFNSEHGLPDHVIRAMTFDEKGILWLATHSAGLVRYDGTNFESFGRSYGIPNVRLWCLMSDRRGRIWAGTDSGIWIFDPASGRGKVVDQSHGLPSMNVLFLGQDHRGGVWVGTTRGVSHLTEDGAVVQNYGAQHGLSDSEVAENAVLVDQNGYVWMGMSNGLTRVNPELLSANPHPPRAVLERVLVNGQVISGVITNREKDEKSDPITLDPGADEVRFEFAALCFLVPENARFRFMLEGFDPRMNLGTEESHVTYRNLGNGSYRFVLQASTSPGIWSDPVHVNLILRPDWYETVFFKVVCLFLGIVALAGLSFARTASLRRKRIQLEQLVGERTTELKRANEHITEQNLLLKELSRTDPLTGLSNRRVLQEQLPIEMAVHIREVTRLKHKDLWDYHGLVVIMMDLDGFKEINDRYGHETGDTVLKGIAMTLNESLREIDLAVRWGGDEFVILGRSLNAYGAEQLSRRILSMVESLEFSVPTDESIRVAASIGYVRYPLSREVWIRSSQWSLLVDAADALLYHAKSRGKARACGVTCASGSKGNEAEGKLLEAVIQNPSRLPGELVMLEICTGDLPGDSELL
ncbi:MAG TPA: two-component regulator propeller domain-containing protein [Thermoanaerobaculia bacterium]|nr:two-component regulator propeller domain-containing protein [Thermoanaerobaculia bacterium]HUM28998.1 two-component regulator propeller domain-containing protein [Thermoanaerobaculia bacterium]HXK67446.1 two-component regulator propeller domain-containing protein [Thermoanaerobaculia bacterium]